VLMADGLAERMVAVKVVQKDLNLVAALVA
jgi:hypothetical protein